MAAGRPQSGGSGAGSAHPNGLCDSCAHQQLVPNTRGSVFSLCLRSRTDERFPRYPPVPVAACLGYERRGKDFGGRVDSDGPRAS